MPDLAVSLDELGGLAAALLGEGQGLRFCARGASMRPFIRDGDVLDVRPVDVRRLRRGDVVLFRDGEDRLLAHRVVRVSRAGLATQGDALARSDGVIEYDRLLGRVCSVERGGRQIAVGGRWRRWSALLFLGFRRARRAYSLSSAAHETSAGL